MHVASNNQQSSKYILSPAAPITSAVRCSVCLWSEHVVSGPWRVRKTKNWKRRRLNFNSVCSFGHHVIYDVKSCHLLSTSIVVKLSALWSCKPAAQCSGVSRHAKGPRSGAIVVVLFCSRVRSPVRRSACVVGRFQAVNLYANMFRSFPSLRADDPPCVMRAPRITRHGGCATLE